MFNINYTYAIIYKLNKLQRKNFSISHMIVNSLINFKKNYLTIAKSRVVFGHSESLILFPNSYLKKVCAPPHPLIKISIDILN